MEPRERQEAQYDFPYHYLLSQDQPNIWRVARYLHWGYEYFTVLDAVVNMVSHYQPKRLLDFGCGDGRLIRDLTNRSPDLEVIGVDRSERALAFAEAILHGKPKVRLVTGLSRIDRTLLPVEAVMAMEVLEHIPPLDLKPLTEELQAVLSPYGIFIVTVPSLNIPLNKKGNVSEVDFEPEVCHDDVLFTRRMSWCSFPCSVPTVKAIRLSRVEPPKLANNAIAAKTPIAAIIPLCSIPLIMGTYLKSKSKLLTCLSMAAAFETRRGYCESALQRSLTS
jgi:SAM-dependent methyltransferase